MRWLWFHLCDCNAIFQLRGRAWSSNMPACLCVTSFEGFPIRFSHPTSYGSRHGPIFFSRTRVASDCSLKDACKESRLYECYRSDFHPMSYVVWRIRYRAKGILAKHMRLNLCVDNSVGQRERCMYVRFQAWGITCCDAVHTGCTTKQDHTSVPGLGSCTGSFINPFTLEDD